MSVQSIKHLHLNMNCTGKITKIHIDNTVTPHKMTLNCMWYKGPDQ